MGRLARRKTRGEAGMNSKQINFYLTSSDQAELIRRLDVKVQGELIAVFSRVQRDRPELIDLKDIHALGKEHLSVYLLRPVDLDQVILRENPHQQYKVFDDQRSSVVSFSRCFRTESGLHRGRLY